MSNGVGVNSFFDKSAFDDATTKIMGEAFESVCTSLHDIAFCDVIKQVIAGRIIEVERRTGERDPRRLSQAALRSLGIPE
jgi:hypothetical protein